MVLKDWPEAPWVVSAIYTEHEACNGCHNVTDEYQSVHVCEFVIVLNHGEDQAYPLSHEADDEYDNVDDAFAMITFSRFLIVLNHVTQFHPI